MVSDAASDSGSALLPLLSLEQGMGKAHSSAEFEHAFSKTASFRVLRDAGSAVGSSLAVGAVEASVELSFAILFGGLLTESDRR